MSDDVGDPKRKEEVKTSDQKVAGKDWNSEKKKKIKRRGSKLLKKKR